MNHRYDKRYSLFLDAEVKTVDDQITLVKTFDISVSGIGLTYQSHSMQLNQLVKISLSVEGHSTREYLLKGLIAHKTNDRIGVIFMRDYTADVHHLLLSARRLETRPQPEVLEEIPLASIRKRAVGM
ncbi:MAG: PilZ domain-containing protein [Methylococcales bacterium]